MLIYIFGTMMDNRLVGYIISSGENEEGESKGGHAPFGTRFCLQSLVCYTLYLCVCEKSVFVNRVSMQKQTKRAWFLCPKLSSFISR